MWTCRHDFSLVCMKIKISLGFLTSGFKHTRELNVASSKRLNEKSFGQVDMSFGIPNIISKISSRQLDMTFVKAARQLP